MSIWIASISLAVVCLVFSFWPMIRRAKSESDRAEYDLSIYRQQLSEVDRDEVRGQIAAEDAEAARIEIKRRMLKVADNIDAELSAKSTKPLLAGLLAIAVLASTVGFYIYVGSPEYSDQPLSARLEAVQSQMAASGLSPEEMEDLTQRALELEEKIKGGEATFQNWWLLARSWMVLGRPDKGVPAFRQAVALEPERPDVIAAYAEALVMAAGNQVGPEAVMAFEKLYRIEPRDPRSRYYIGLAEAQSQRYEEAMAIWLDLLKDAEPGAPWVAMVRGNIKDVAIALGRDPADVLPEETAKGPSQDDVAAARNMSAEDRTEMIAGMVENLSARLAENPDDLQGWTMLIRSYVVLNQRAEADNALKTALAQFDDPQSTQILKSLAGQLGLE